MKYSGFRRDVKRHVLNFRATSGHNVLYMRNDVSKDFPRFRLPSSGRRRLLLKVPSFSEAALLLVSTKNRDLWNLWEEGTSNAGSPRFKNFPSLELMLRVKSDILIG